MDVQYINLSLLFSMYSYRSVRSHQLVIVTSWSFFIHNHNTDNPDAYCEKILEAIKRVANVLYSYCTHSK